jgi:hypothetical protein
VAIFGSRKGYFTHCVYFSKLFLFLKLRLKNKREKLMSQKLAVIRYFKCSYNTHTTRHLGPRDASRFHCRCHDPLLNIKEIGLFRYIKILTSIRGCEAETIEITRTQGNKKIFLWCSASQLHSLEVKQNI